MAKSLLAVAAGLGLSSALCFPGPLMASESMVQDSADGEFRFQLKDYWLGQQAAIAYQVTPWLNFSWRYDEYDEFVLDTLGLVSSGDDLSGFQYRANVRVQPESQNLPAVYVNAHDFLADQNRRSYGIHAQKRIADWEFALGYAHGDGLDGVQGSVSYTGFGPYFIMDATLHQQKDWAFDVSPFDASALESIDVETPQWTVGATWQPLKWAEFGLAYDDLGEIGLSVTVILDSKRSTGSTRMASVLANEQLTLVGDVDLNAASANTVDVNSAAFEDAIVKALAHINVQVDGLDVNSDLLMLVVAADGYTYWPDAIAQTQYVLNRILPTSIDAVEYIITHQAHALYATREAVVHIDGVAGNLANARLANGRARLRPLSQSQIDLVNDKRTESMANVLLPDVSLDIDNVFYQPQQNDQGFNNTLGYYWGVSLDADWSLGYGWQLETTVQADVAEDFGLARDTVEVKIANGLFAQSDTQNILPLRALQQSNLIVDDARISKALLSKRGTVIKTQRNAHASYHYQVFAGQVSSELHGVGGQVLYQMWQSRVAVGVNFAQLTVSDFDSHTVRLTRKHTFTGTVSAYWASPWHNIDVSMEAGQFIGRDKGALVNVKRTFHNGWQFGLYAAKTRLHGETYTNSGLQLTIPLDGLFGSGHGNKYVPASVNKHLSDQKMRYTSSMQTLGNNTAYSLSHLTSDMWWQQRDARYDVFTQVRL